MTKEDVWTVGLDMLEVATKASSRDDARKAGTRLLAEFDADAARRVAVFLAAECVWLLRKSMGRQRLAHWIEARRFALLMSEVDFDDQG